MRVEHLFLFVAAVIQFIAQLKPLTEEEKKQKLEELKARMAEKRVKKAVEESKEALANEQIRRKSGKVGFCLVLSWRTC